MPAPVLLSGLITYDGVAIPDVEAVIWGVTLQDLETEAWVTYPKLGGPTTYDIAVWPSTYDIYFDFIESGGLPRSIEGSTLMASAADVSVDTSVDLLVRTIPLSGEVRWNGLRPLDDGDGVDNVALVFEDKATGQRLRTVLSGSGADYQTRLYEADYEVWVELLDPADAVTAPVLGEWRYSDSLTIIGPDVALDIDVQPVEVSGDILYDDALIIAADESNDWALHLTDIDTGATFTRTFQGGRTGYQMYVLPGVYNVDFELLDPTATGRPVEGVARVADAVDFTGVSVLDLDLDPVTITGELLYDGAPLERDDPGPDYQIWVTNRRTGSTSAYPASGGLDAYEVHVLPGTYNVDFELLDLNGSVLFPAAGRFVAARDLAVSGLTSLDILPTTVPIGGRVLYDGLPIQTGPERQWQVVLTSRDFESVGLYSFDGGFTDWELSTYPGIWDVGFELLDVRAVLDPVLPGRPFVGAFCADIHP
jgi:hypothetical protein